MTIVDEFRQDDSRVLDRLVDGELSQADRRTLLAALDDEPGAWRRCALAFLEAQSFRWQLNQIATEPLVAQTASQAKRDFGALGRGKRSSFWGACLAIAGSLLVAFGLGTRVAQQSPQVAGTSAEQPTETTSAPLPTETQPSLANATPNSATPNTTTPNTAEPAATTETTPYETLTLAEVDDSGKANPDNQFYVRVRDKEADATELDALLDQGNSPLPASLLEQLRHEGWEVTRSRELVPITLSDGRQVVLPMEQVDIQMSDVAHF
jgi:hypothetical protein